MTNISSAKKAMLVGFSAVAGVLGFSPVILQLVKGQHVMLAVIATVVAGAIPASLTAATKPWEWHTTAAESDAATPAPTNWTPALLYAACAVAILWLFLSWATQA